MIRLIPFQNAQLKLVSLNGGQQLIPIASLRDDRAYELDKEGSRSFGSCSLQGSRNQFYFVARFFEFPDFVSFLRTIQC